MRLDTVELAHEVAVYHPGGFECVRELTGLGFEFADSLALVVVVGLELDRPLFELLEQRAEDLTPGDVCRRSPKFAFFDHRNSRSEAPA
jgi:hypothetical protein